MTAIPAMRPTVHLDLHYQHTLLVEFVLALLWKLLGAIVALCRWLFPVLDSTRTPRHDIDAVHPGATPAYAVVLADVPVTITGHLDVAATAVYDFVLSPWSLEGLPAPLPTISTLIQERSHA